MPWYLYLALKQLFPTGKKLSFFTVISALGVALGVGALVVSIGVMGGFDYRIRQMIVDTQGDIQIHGATVVTDSKAIMGIVAKVPGVAGVTPYANGVVMLEYGRKPIFPTIQGIDLNRVNSVLPLARYVHDGSLDDLDDDGVILSSELADSIDAQVGDTVQVSSPLQLERLKQDEVFLPRSLKVVGIYEIGHSQLDSSTVIVTLRRMQDLYGLGRAVHGFEVKVAPGLDVDAVTRRINAALPPSAGLQAISWIDLNQDFLFVLQLEKNLIFILLLFIIVVAAFSMASSLLISVVRKTREIGLIGALGGRPREIALCFCLQGLFIGVCGTFCGLVLGFGFLHERNDILHLFTWLTGSQEALIRFYQFSTVPAHLETSDLAVIIGSTIVISTLAGVIPAWRAARLKPVEALRNE